MFFYACSSSKECRLSTRKLCDKRCQHNILCSQFIIFLHWITAEYYVLCWFIFAFSKWKASSVPFAYPALQNREACRMPSIFTHAKIAPLILFLSFFCYFFFFTRWAATLSSYANLQSTEKKQSALLPYQPSLSYIPCSRYWNVKTYNIRAAQPARIEIPN